MRRVEASGPRFETFMKLSWIDVEHMSDCGMNEKPTLLPLCKGLCHSLP